MIVTFGRELRSVYVEISVAQCYFAEIGLGRPSTATEAYTQPYSKSSDPLWMKIGRLHALWSGSPWVASRAPSVVVGVHIAHVCPRGRCLAGFTVFWQVVGQSRVGATTDILVWQPLKRLSPCGYAASICAKFRQCLRCKDCFRRGVLPQNGGGVLWTAQSHVSILRGLWIPEIGRIVMQTKIQTTITILWSSACFYEFVLE